MRGVRAVEKAIRVFSKVRDKLINAINECSEEIAEKEEKIKDIGMDVALISATSARAEKILAKINEIIG